MRHDSRAAPRGGGQLLKIMNDVLDLSKIEEGKLEVEFIEFDVSVVLGAVVSQIRVPSEQKGLRLDVQYEGFAHTSVVGDPVRVQQILSNFAWNSVKFTEKGSITLRAVQSPAAGKTVAVSDEGRPTESRRLVFSVTDTGPGISLEAQRKLFQPYVQADRSTARQYGGTGLGLSICKNLARLMSGDVGFTSVPGQGATFYLTLDMQVPSHHRLFFLAPLPLSSPEFSPIPMPRQTPPPKKNGE